MEKSEISFWQEHADKDSLLMAIQSQRERAIRFFGAEAVLSQDEAALYRVLEAHRIVAASDRALLVSINRIPRRVLSKVATMPWQVKGIKKPSPYTLRDVARMKGIARRRLQNALGAPPD